jgi:hypothetical protein
MTTKAEISSWFDRGLDSEDKPTHMLVVCDTFDYEDYPVYVKPEQDAKSVYDAFNKKNMQKVMEVYNLGVDKQIQMNTARVFNF